MDQEIASFLANIGFRSTAIHRSFDHFDFSRGSRLILVVGPMGAGKTEFAARVWRDAEVAQKKAASVGKQTTTTSGADRRNIFIVKNALDAIRFPRNPRRSLSYRGGWIDCGESIAEIEDSFGLEHLIETHPHHGIWIIDEAAFYDERIAFVIRRCVRDKELVFICPTLSLNFRRKIFNPTANFLIEYASDVFPLTAYCEHPDCLQNAVYSYRYYMTKTSDDTVQKTPALYFDPLIMVDGDAEHTGTDRPHYEARCTTHHFLPGMQYTHMILKPYAQRALNDDPAPLVDELAALHRDPHRSHLGRDFATRYQTNRAQHAPALSALSLPRIAERAIIYLYAEINLLASEMVRRLVQELSLDGAYLKRVLSENGRSIEL